jgi:hypothetical protein
VRHLVVVTFSGFADVPDELLELVGRLPADEPVTSADARERGVGYPQLRALVRHGLVKRPVHGVYAVATLPDMLRFRVSVLKLVVPESCVVTDRTAAWLWGADMVLAPNDHLTTPRVSVFCPPGCRLRRTMVASGERRLSSADVSVIDGLRVTRPLRTACDLGRLLHRDQAIAALDSLTALGAFGLDELLEETTRFRGYRGVVQLRALALLVDPRSQSPGESVLRLRWIDTGLPRPECQVEVPTAWGTSYWLDIGLPELCFAAEYDGEEFHDETQAAHDRSRREWLRHEGGWTIEVARKENVYGREQDIHRTLRIAYDDAFAASRRVPRAV